MTYEPDLLHAAALPSHEAIQFFRQKTVLPSAQFGAVMDEAHSRAFTVTGAVEETLLNDLKSAMNEAITQGTPFSEFQKSFKSIAKRNQWEHDGEPGWRARIIYTTNISTAYSAGQYAQLNTTEARDIFPYWRYLHHSCQHPRQLHIDWSGTVLRNDDPWWSTHYPPNGWRCHCTVEPVTRAEMESNGWSVDEAPPLNPQPWENPATGKTDMVPDGIDPSFAYNPGKAWLDNEQARAAEHPPLQVRPAHGPVSRHLAQQKADIAALLQPQARGMVNAGTLPTAVVQALGSQSESVILSDDSLSKNRAKHHDLPDEAYLAIPQMIAEPVIAAQDTPLTVTLISLYQEQLYRMAIKRTRTGEENFLQSFSRTKKRSASKTVRKSVVIMGELKKDDE